MSIMRSKHRGAHAGSIPSVVLQLDIPRTNDKKELAAEQMFAALHGILRDKADLRINGSAQEHISFEFASIGKRIRFYVWCPKHLQTFVEGQIYAQYPTVQISELSNDYASRELTQPVVYSADLTLTENETIPIKTFPSFEVDPLAGITATLAELSNDNEEMWVQVLCRPLPDSWHKKGLQFIKRIKNGGGLFAGSGGNALMFAGQLAGALFKPPTEKGKEPDISERDKARIKSIEEKSTKLGYEIKIRIVYLGDDPVQARLRMQAMIASFKQFNTTNLNGFKGINGSFDTERVQNYTLRKFDSIGFILNIEELASVYHLPHTSVETPNIVWATVKTAEPPATLPTHKNTPEADISLFGITNFRGSNTPFGIKRGDRSRHIYIIGQTGTGKSGLLQLLTLSDIYYGKGVGLIDPHGDYAIDMLKAMPEQRIKDVVYFNPSDSSYPIGFNPLEVTDPTMKGQISSELVGVLKRMFDSWGPRLEYILRYTILALLDYPKATMLDITRMLTEKKFRDDVIGHIDDIVVKTFWTNEFASWNEKFATEAVAPVLNKVGAFVANPMIRNIIGQPESTFNIRRLMDEGKILIVNLSRGLIGEDNAGILGAMMVTKIQLAAMSRANMHASERTPFYLYVDEFQNFATDSFAVILSEARKYGLTLTVANQYISQMSPAVRDAVFGNVGSMVVFRVGADDAPFLAKYFAPAFDDQDLKQLSNMHFVTTLTIDGEKTAGFSGHTLRLPSFDGDYLERIIDHSRTTYAQPREVVENMIRSRAEAMLANQSSTPPQQRSHSNHQQNHQAQQGHPANAGQASKIPTHAGTPVQTQNALPNHNSKRRRSRRRSHNNQSLPQEQTKYEHVQDAESGQMNENDTIKLR